VVMKETLLVVVEGLAWMFLIIGLHFDSRFTARAFFHCEHEETDGLIVAVDGTSLLSCIIYNVNFVLYV
jgi:hypothetical protein